MGDVVIWEHVDALSCIEGHLRWVQWGDPNFPWRKISVSPRPLNVELGSDIPTKMQANPQGSTD